MRCVWILYYKEHEEKVLKVTFYEMVFWERVKHIITSNPVLLNNSTISFISKLNFKIKTFCTVLAFECIYKKELTYLFIQVELPYNSKKKNTIPPPQSTMSLKNEILKI